MPWQLTHHRATDLLGAAARYGASGTELFAALGCGHQALLATTRAGLGGDRFEAEYRRGATLPLPGRCSPRSKASGVCPRPVTASTICPWSSM